MSSAFRPKGVAAARGVGPRREIKDYPVSRLCIVDGYDLNRGVMKATHKKTGQKLEVTIAHREYKPSTTASAADRKWTGGKIDEMMAESLTEGSWVLLEGSKGTERVMRGKESVLIVTARWIKNISEPREDKCFDGIITAKAYRNTYQSFQDWDEKAISANDQEALEAFAQELDGVHAKYLARERPVRRGFQFRMVEEIEPAVEGRNGKADQPPVYQAINFSYPIDFLQSESDDETDIGAPPTGADFKNFVNQYIDHIYGTEDGKTPPAFEEERLKNMRFEIATYRNYKAGDPKYNPDMEFEDPQPGRYPSRSYTLTHTPTRYSFDDEYVQGKNWAVRGVLQLINDTTDKKTRTFVENYMARQLFTDGPIGNVHTMIAASDGGRVKVHPDLDYVREVKNTNEGESAAPSSDSGLSQRSEDALVGSDDPFAGEGGSFVDGGEADAFLDAGSDAAPAAPAAEEPPAPAPAADEPSSGDSAATGAKRFQRRGSSV